MYTHMCVTAINHKKDMCLKESKKGYIRCLRQERKE